GMADGRHARGFLVRMAASLAIDRSAAHDPGHDVELCVLRYGFVNGARDVLTLTCVQAVDQRRNDADRELLTRDVISVPNLRRYGRKIVVAARIPIIPAV